jgi:formamidopyrimidine-DNA glycosylase
MPELPEVETVRRALERHVTGRTVRTVWLSGLSLRKPVPPALARRAPGRTIVAVRRHGKFLLVDFDGGARIVAHLGMTGHFRFHASDPGPPRSLVPHTHAVLRFVDGTALSYEDPRRFGMLDWAEAGVPDLRVLGPTGAGLDPMVERIDGARLAALFARCRGPIKHLLLDQKRIAGIGNIYASEALFRAGIGPRRFVHTLTAGERERLASEIHAVLDQAVENRGTTLSDFRDLDERPGSYGESLLVYDREGEPCLTCGTAIRRIVQTGRSTFYCGTCQRKTRAGEASRAKGRAAAR